MGVLNDIANAPARNSCKSGAVRDEIKSNKRYDLIPREVFEWIGQKFEAHVEYKQLAYSRLLYIIKDISNCDYDHAMYHMIWFIEHAYNPDILSTSVPTYSLERLAITLNEGAVKYGERNWEKGLPERDLQIHAIDHLLNYVRLDLSEDHLGHALCNIMFAYVLQQREHFCEG